MIVSRGLGLGGFGSLVAIGLGLSLPIVILPETPPTDPIVSWVTHRATVKGKVTKAGRLVLPAIEARELLAKIEARGSANVKLYTEVAEGEYATMAVSGGANFGFIGVAGGSEAGKVLAKGIDNLTNEQIVALLLESGLL